MFSFTNHHCFSQHDNPAPVASLTSTGKSGDITAGQETYEQFMMMMNQFSAARGAASTSQEMGSTMTQSNSSGTGDGGSGNDSISSSLPSAGPTSSDTPSSGQSMEPAGIPAASLQMQMLQHMQMMQMMQRHEQQQQQGNLSQEGAEKEGGDVEGQSQRDDMIVGELLRNAADVNAAGGSPSVSGDTSMVSAVPSSAEALNDQMDDEQQQQQQLQIQQYYQQQMQLYQQMLLQQQEMEGGQTGERT